MTREETAAFFARRHAAYNSQDAKTLVDDYTEDCVIESPAGGTHVGRKAAEHVLRNVFAALDARLHELSVIIDGDLVAQVVSIEGKDVGQFLGLPPTGRSFRVPGVFLYDMKHGKIARERRIYDFTALLVQIGLLKAKPAL